MSQTHDTTRQAATDLIEGLLAYLVDCQETEGEYAGSFWSELAYHIPHLDYRGGGSHHNRTVGSAALGLRKLADDHPELDLRARAERAFDWVITRQHEDGGMFEITNNEKPSQFHLEYERSSISLGMVVHGMHLSMQLGLPEKAEYRDFLVKAAQWQLTVETDPGNFLHTEGYPEDKLILNAAVHAAETLLVGAEMAEDATQADVFRAGAVRAIEAIMRTQRDNGMLPYSNYPDDNSISYTATVCWVFQNLIDSGLMPEELPADVNACLQRAAAFMASCVRPDGAMDWDTWENHGQKYHTWVYGMVARALAWHDDAGLRDAAARLMEFLRREMFDPQVGLCRLLDYPVGEERSICGVPVLSEDFHRCAYHQSDMFDCLIDARMLLAEG